MHQTAREFLIRTIPDASQLQFEITDKAHGTITTTWIRYLMLCFTSPRIQDIFSKIESWSPSDFRAYAEYLKEWPLTEYTLRYMKEHHDLCGSGEEASQLIATLVQLLASNHASYFLSNFMDGNFGASLITCIISSVSAS